MPSFDPARLSNLYKPALILISTYLFVNVIGFFVQHDFNRSYPLIGLQQVDAFAEHHFVPVYETQVTPAPPEVKINPKKNKIPLGETINPHLP